MNAYEFAHQIDTVRQRADTLQNQAHNSPLPSSQLLHDCLEELNTALEELRIAEEELRQQNEELTNSRHELEKERQRYQELFDFAPDGYLVTDVDGKILEANRATSELFKISSKYLKGKLLVSFVPEHERRHFRSRLIQLQHTKQINDCEIRMQTRESIVFDASISVTAIYDDKNQLIGWRWLVRNITSRKQAEEQIRAIQLENLQLQEATRIKSHFLAMMSHEMRTPMNVILGFSQLLLRIPNYHQLPSSARNMVERIFASAKHLLAIIEDILDFSKLEAGRLELIVQEFDLAELVTTTTEELRCLAEQKNLKLSTIINLQNPNCINDRDRVRQILVNLLSNAIKFTDIGNVTVEVIDVQNRVIITVKDTGIGMNEADLKQIFHEFRQINQSITRKHGGTGLGLAIVDKLIRLMQGTIRVESKFGEGSTFRVELPKVVNV